VDLADQITCDPHPYGLVATGQAASDPITPHRTVEPASWDVEIVVEVVQVPAQPLLALAAHDHQIVVMIKHRSQVQLTAGQLRCRQPINALPDRGPGDRQRVDRITLTAFALPLAHTTHQPPRHPRHRLTSRD
jgi:hypothetical protein